jgi:2-polyprenyl-3-methyl-5-hydroxy-6-metoxy-1,4-benzoquinol methylase
LPVTQNEIELAYRLIFGRGPENQAAVDRLLGVEDLSQLRKAFVDSEEFRLIHNVRRTGEFVDAGPVEIQISCTLGEIDELTNRIAVEWRRFGETEPHWSVLTGEEYLSGNIDKNANSFYASGHRDVERLLKGIARSGYSSEHFGKVLDFGCGVGRLVLALAERAEHVTGVDISPPHLKIARARAESVGTTNVDFVAIDTLSGLDQFKGFDLVTSHLVIQHNPPPVQAMILRKLLAALAPGGIAVLQIPTYLVHATKFSVSDYLNNKQPAMEMNALPQKYIYETVDECGCRCLEVLEDGVLGTLPGISQTFTILKKVQP